MAQPPLVSVGIPTYNKPEGLRRTLECITGQTYKNLEIIVSDNCSPDPDVEKVTNEFIMKDGRVHYYRQTENKGASFNFQFVLEKATGEYFMWAADDDEWENEFIEVCLNNLTEKNMGLSFCGIDNIDTFGQTIRNYPLLPRLSGPATFSTIFKYLLDPEIQGKANIICGLYRIQLCRKSMSLMKNAWNVWGGDMCFNLAAIAREGLYIDSRVLFHKRISRTTDAQGATDKIIINNPQEYVFDVDEFFHYLKANLEAVKGTRFYFLTLTIMIFRYVFKRNNLLIRSINNSIRKAINYLSGKAALYP